MMDDPYVYAIFMLSKSELAKRDDSKNFKRPPTTTTTTNNNKNRQDNPSSKENVAMTQDHDFQGFFSHCLIIFSSWQSNIVDFDVKVYAKKLWFTLDLDIKFQGENWKTNQQNPNILALLAQMNKKKFEKLASTFDQQQQQQNINNEIIHHFADNVFINENNGHRSSITVIPAQPCSSVNGSEQSRKERSRSQGRLSQIFPSNKGVERLEMLEKLTSFQENSLLTARLLLKDHPDAQHLCEESFRIEEHWQDIVGESEIPNRKLQEQQDVLWELITTELNYIKQICSIVELKSNLENLQRDSNLLIDLECEKIFVNICDIGRANLLFWLQSLHPLVQEAKMGGAPLLDPSKLESGFENLHKLFEPYLWVQSRRFFGRLHLTDLLAKPMQRLTKYPLLLKAILKCTLDPAAKDSLNRMIDVAEEFASKVNFELCRKQHLDALRSIMQCMEYDAIETTNDELERFVKEKTFFDLTAPMLGCHTDLMRRLVLRGELKLREAYLKVDVVCFLFTDLFMVCKMLGKKDGFAFVCLNEFRSPSMASIFVTHGSDETVKWLEHIDMAK
uniref:DH domain-containing protein n=1 Tax=Romanomermis culicivorax TaxID=13658 RepID=A0A915L9L2_ROMCU